MLDEWREDSDTAPTVQFEWDSDSSHHFTGTKNFFIPGSFVVQQMNVYIADRQCCYAEGYGSFGHRMLKKVWYVPKFKGRPNLFSDVIAMSDGFSCQRIGQTLEYLENGIVIKTGELKSNRWILEFDLSNDDQSIRSIEPGHANGTGMGILPVPVQTVLILRRCNHVGPYILYLAVNKGLTLRHGMDLEANYIHLKLWTVLVFWTLTYLQFLKANLFLQN